MYQVFITTSYRLNAVMSLKTKIYIIPITIKFVSEAEYITQFLHRHQDGARLRWDADGEYGSQLPEGQLLKKSTHKADVMTTWM